MVATMKLVLAGDGEVDAIVLAPDPGVIHLERK